MHYQQKDAIVKLSDTVDVHNDRVSPEDYLVKSTGLKRASGLLQKRRGKLIECVSRLVLREYQLDMFEVE